MIKNITVQYVNEVKPGKKMASVKTDAGEYFSVEPEMLSQFSQGGTYEVEYTSRQWEGKAYYTIKKIVGNAPQTPQNAPRIVGAPATGDVRSGRIERQHSQEMALRYFALVGGLDDPKTNTDKLRTLTDWFQRDIGHQPDKQDEDEVF